MFIKRQHTSQRMSLIAEHGDVVYLAGIVADRRDADIAGQTKEVLAKIDQLLADAGVTKDNVFKATIWLRDIANFDAMNGVWDAWVPAGKSPVRACVEARMAAPDILVEIQVTAARS